jgi:hypothetical protein
MVVLQAAFGAMPPRLHDAHFAFLGLLAGTLMLSLLPAVIVIALAERRRRTSLRFYAISGAVVGILCFSGSALSFSIYAQSLEIFLLQLRYVPLAQFYFIQNLLTGAAAGAVAGAIYWWIAGRHAGRARGEQVT